MTHLQLAVAVSELLAIYLIWRSWRSADHIILKVATTVVALIPFIGPLVAYWVSDFPEPHHPRHRDVRPKSADVYHRWASFLRMTDAKKKRSHWRKMKGLTEDGRDAKD